MVVWRFIDPHRHLAGGQHIKTTIETSNGPQVVPDYALIQGIFIGCVSAYVIILALIGPENHGSHFENSKTAIEADSPPKEEITTTREHEIRDFEKSSVGSTAGKEEGGIELVETTRRIDMDNYV